MLDMGYFPHLLSIHGPPFWTKQAQLDRRTLSALGWCVPYNLNCAYDLHESALERLLARIPPNYNCLQAPQGPCFEQESLFPYKSQNYIDNLDTSLWIVPYTERVLRVCATLLFSSYELYVV